MRRSAFSSEPLKFHPRLANKGSAVATVGYSSSMRVEVQKCWWVRTKKASDNSNNIYLGERGLH